MLDDISPCISFNVDYSDTEIGVTHYGYTAAVIAKKIVQNFISDSVYTCTPTKRKLFKPGLTIIVRFDICVNTVAVTDTSMVYGFSGDLVVTYGNTETPTPSVSLHGKNESASSNDRVWDVAFPMVIVIDPEITNVDGSYSCDNKCCYRS